jgi:hypothetical protein
MLTMTEPTIRQSSHPEKYVNCKCCGAILGYRAHTTGVEYLFVFAHPALHPGDNMQLRPICARILNGDVFCRRCSTWRTWCPGSERPWEK